MNQEPDRTRTQWLSKRRTYLTFALLVFVAIAFFVWRWLFSVPPAPPPLNKPPRHGSVDVEEKPVPWIPAGLVIEQTAPPGWSHLIYVARPRISEGDVAAVSKTVHYYAKLFTVNCLASVEASHNQPDQFQLGKVAIGIGTQIDGKNMSITSGTQEKLGADLSLIGRQLLAQCENDFRTGCTQIARTSTMIVFDSNIVMLAKREHRPMVARYAILVQPKSGELTTLVWLFDAAYQLVDESLRKLDPNHQEDRVLHANAAPFLLDIPLDGALAQVRLPVGTSIPISSRLRRVVEPRRYTIKSATELERELQSISDRIN